MSEDSAIIAKAYQRQEHLIALVNDLTSITEINQALLVELTEMLKEPPKSDLPALIAALVQAVSDLGQEVRALPKQMQEMFDRAT